MAANPSDSRTFSRIDVHQHIVPEMYVSALRSMGIVPAHGAGLPKWSPSLVLETMDKHGIAAAIFSVSSPGVYFRDIVAASKLARQCNEYSAQTVRDKPDRFGFFATLPMPATEAAVKEAVYALDSLNADGVVLLSSVEGKYLGDPDFEELMAELNSHKAIVFMHPNMYPTSQQIKLNFPGYLIEFVFDTTRAVTNLVFSGSIERYPDIRWIVSHAGGTVPFIAWRLATVDRVRFPNILEKAPRGVLAYLRSLYYDTALAPSPYAMRALLELVDPSQILLGSDYPYASEPRVALEVSDLQGLKFFDETIRKAVDRQNGLRLFPRFNATIEKVASTCNDS